MKKTSESNSKGTSDVPLKEVNNKYFFVYTLLSLKDKKFYTGFTTNLKQRLSEHFYGKVASTKFRRPFKLVHSEMFLNEIDARAREIFLKSGFGRKQLKQALKRTLAENSS